VSEGGPKIKADNILVGGISRVNFDGFEKVVSGSCIVTGFPFLDAIEIEDLKVMRSDGEQLDAERPGVGVIVVEHESAQVSDLRLQMVGMLLGEFLHEGGRVLIAMLLHEDRGHGIGYAEGVRVGGNSALHHSCSLVEHACHAVGAGEIEGEVFRNWRRSGWR
jgi:hypothetical protein